MKRLAAAALAAIPVGGHAFSTSDLRDYAIASCLAKQTASHELQGEGYRLAGIVIARAGITPFTWKPLEDAVGAALAGRGMLMVHTDAPVGQSTQPAPLASCLLVIDTPSVRRVAETLERKGKR